MADETKETVSAQDLVEDAWQVNLKQMFDEFKQLFSAQAQQNHIQLAQLNQISMQALQNAVVTADLTAKQAVAHRDIAIRAEWDLAGQASIDAIASSVAEKLTATISPTIPGPSTSPKQ